MGSLFNIDNPFFTFISKLWDLMVLSLLWALCCLPILTIGPATAALYYTVVKVIRRERGYILKEYFHSFKQNFKLGVLSTLIFVILGIVLYFDFQYIKLIRESKSNLAYFLTIALSAIVIIVLAELVYIYPVLSRFTFRIGALFKTTFFIAMRHLFSTIAIILLVSASGLAIYIIIPAVFIVPSLCALLVSLIMERVLKKYTPVPEETEEQDGKDQWYLE